MKKIWGLLILTPMLFIGTSCGSHSAGVEDEIEEPFGESGKSSGMTSLEFAKRLSIGWNLGNTLDANSKDTKTNLGLSTETSWGMPETTQKMIQTVASKGFKTIRIPVSWHNHITSDDGNYTIDSEWMARVNTVVDWAIDANMFVILNVHHDDLTKAEMNSTYGYCVDLDSTMQTKSKAYLKAVWKQIATKFASYDDHLIFEVLNEPRCIGTAYEWSTGNYNDEVKAANKVIMEYEKAALETIRATGGKNSTRYIMIPPYAASPNMIDGWSLPSDSVSGKLIVSIHAYTPYEFCMGDDNSFSDSHKGSIDWLFSTLKGSYIGKGIPVVIGEASASDKGNTSERVKWAGYYFNKAKSVGIPVVIWDNNVVSTQSGGDGTNKAECHGYFNRTECTWYFPNIVNEMLKYK